MGKKAHLDISESLAERKKLQAKQKTLKGEKRIRCLVEIKSDRPKNKQSKIIGPEAQKGLERKVNDPHNPFLGYWDAQDWVRENYGVDVKYHRIREYLIQHFKTKSKTPRKSHYKKDEEAEKAFLTSPNVLNNIGLSLNKDKYNDVNLYFQDEARFGMMNHLRKYITASGVKPIVTYQQVFKTTYLYGSYSPINGDGFVWEISGVNTKILEKYLREFSLHKPSEYKVVVIDNAGFHSTKKIEVPENIHLLRIPPYNPELNPCEQIWQYVKNRFKNQRFETMDDSKKWLYHTVGDMTAKTIKSITGNHHYLSAFIRHLTTKLILVGQNQIPVNF